MTRDKLDVLVTSRACESHAAWFLKHLRSHRYRGLVGSVTYLPISNSNGREWKSRVANASFGILYHTKCFGRINITDVADSLYDRELKHLSEELGKPNVIVVVDDLEKSDDEERDRILQNQPKISLWASNLLLFSNTEKDPIPESKQLVLLDSFHAAQNQLPQVQWKQKMSVLLAAGMAAVFGVVVGKRFYKRKRF